MDNWLQQLLGGVGAPQPDQPVTGPSLLQRLLGQGDPEAAGAAQASQAMEPVTGPYMRDVASGQMGANGLKQLLGGYQWDQNATPMQNAVAMSRDPTALAQAANVALSMGPGAIKAYHGSPYNFDKFDLSKIGTGEGAQAYGHGIYLAEAKPTAQAYRDTLSGGSYRTADGTVLHGGAAHDLLANAASDAQLATQRGKEFTLHPDQARAVASNLLDGIKDAGSIAKYLKDYDLPGGQFGVAYQHAAQKAQELGLRTNPGRMYEVNINADPEQFLNWDKPLAQQPIEARNIADTLTRVNAGVAGKSAPQTGMDIWQSMRSPFAARELGYKNWSSSGPAEYLKDTGIPGIRYLDQGSRGAGDGTSNYVVFDPKLIDILRKYGLGGLLGGAGAVAAGNPYGEGGR